MKYLVNTRRMSKVYERSASGYREILTEAAIDGDGLIIDIEDTDESHVFVVYEKSENYMSMRVFYDVKSVIDFINSHAEITVNISLFYAYDGAPRAKFAIKKNRVETESKVVVYTKYDDELEVIKELHNTFARSADAVEGYLVGYVDSITGEESEKLYEFSGEANLSDYTVYKYEIKDTNGVIADVNSLSDYHCTEDSDKYDPREYEHTVWRTFYTVIGDNTYDDILSRIEQNIDERCEVNIEYHRKKREEYLKEHPEEDEDNDDWILQDDIDDADVMDGHDFTYGLDDDTDEDDSE